MDVHQLFEFYARKLQDEQCETWNVDEFMVDADRGHSELLEAAGGLQEEGFALTYDTSKSPNYAYFLLPARIVSLKWVKISLGGTLVKLVEYPEDQLHDDWENDTGTPVGFVREAFRGIRTWPYDDDLAPTLTGRGKLGPQSLALLGTPQLPVDYHLAPAYFAIAEALDRQPDPRDQGAADRWRAKFLADKARLAPRGLRKLSSRGRVIPSRFH